ncbi:hypothetical protein VTK73DRAFT_5666 [Phialemonium thermophilum]|uniref:Uncharacterized protein n=1 Tax=Phialemonium thermophilum TaxID=223376 RepID=A0ABR3V130_9PEZI
MRQHKMCENQRERRALSTLASTPVTMGRGDARDESMPRMPAGHEIEHGPSARVYKEDGEDGEDGEAARSETHRNGSWARVNYLHA